MGARCSRRVTYRYPVTTAGNNYMFYHGCIGLTGDMYNIEQQLASGPGLVVPFYGKTMNELMALSQVCIKSLAANKLKEFIEETVKLRPPNFRVSAAERRLGEQTGVNVPDPKQETPPTAGTEETDKEPDFLPYDERADLEKRLKDLLRKLNAMEWLPMLMADYDQRISDAKRMEESDLPPSVRAVEEKKAKLSETKFATPQLPPLPSQKSNASGNEEFVLLGPAYMLMSNDVDYGVMEAYMFFPSITSDIRTSPNYDFLGRSHRWLNRLINDDMYVAKGAGCEQSCYGTPKYITTKRRGRCDKEETMYACGCRTDNPKRPACYHDPPRRSRDFNKLQYKKGKGGAPIMYQYVVYRINPFHSSIKGSFDKDSPTEILTNIVSSLWDVFPGRKYSIISRNKQFHARFETVMTPIPGTQQGRGKNATMMYSPFSQFALFYNNPRKYVPKLVIRARGYPVRVTIENNMLNIYTSDKKQVVATNESLQWSIQIAKDDAKPPLALVLLDDGRFDVFDRENKSVLTPQFSKYVEAANDLYKKESDLPDFVTTGENGEYDPEAEYLWRIENLRQWLRARSLLIEVVSQVYDIESTRVLQATGGEVGEFIPFDPNVDYAMRYNKLIELLNASGVPFLSIPSSSSAVSPEAQQKIGMSYADIEGKYKDSTAGLKNPVEGTDSMAKGVHDRSGNVSGNFKGMLETDTEINDDTDISVKPNDNVTKDHQAKIPTVDSQKMSDDMQNKMSWLKPAATDTKNDKLEIAYDASADYKQRLEYLKAFIASLPSSLSR